MTLDDTVKDTWNLMGCVGTVTSMVIGGFVGTFVGTGVGYIVGNVADWIPFVNQVAPWIANYVGFQQDPHMNENFYQLSLGVSGLYGGIGYIPKLLAKNER